MGELGGYLTLAHIRVVIVVNEVLILHNWHLFLVIVKGQLFAILILVTSDELGRLPLVTCVSIMLSFHH